MPRLKTTLEVTARQLGILEELQKKGSLAHKLNFRITIILKTVSGLGSLLISREFSCSKNTVISWRKRWKLDYDSLVELEEELGQGKPADKMLRERILEVFSDEPRSGKPRDFTEEQDLKIVALACESPLQYDIPQSHWTWGLLAQEAAKRGIVQSISSSQIGRILKKYGHSTASE